MFVFFYTVEVNGCRQLSVGCQHSSKYVILCSIK